jgi:hypothetical protein
MGNMLGGLPAGYTGWNTFRFAGKQWLAMLTVNSTAIYDSRGHFYGGWSGVYNYDGTPSPKSPIDTFKQFYQREGEGLDLGMAAQPS